MNDNPENNILMSENNIQTISLFCLIFFDIKMLFFELSFKGDELINSLKGAVSGLRQFLPTKKPFKIDEKRFLFHFKSSFLSQDI